MTTIPIPENIAIKVESLTRKAQQWCIGAIIASIAVCILAVIDLAMDGQPLNTYCIIGIAGTWWMLFRSECLRHEATKIVLGCAIAMYNNHPHEWRPSRRFRSFELN